MADQPAQMSCKECEDDYCEVCFAAQHRKGSRKKHAVTPISGSPGKRTEKAQDGVSHVAPGTADGEGKSDKVAGVCTSWCRRAFFEPHPTQVDADVEMEDDSGAELDQIAAKSATGPSMEPLGAQPNIPGASGRQRMH